VIEYYLDIFIFPETMEHQDKKLAANGQDVGGDMLFRTKLGFSGTPSDLVPVELGRCQFEMGNTAMMLHFLCDPQASDCSGCVRCVINFVTYRQVATIPMCSVLHCVSATARQAKHTYCVSQWTSSSTWSVVL
jgi:hypothetical protein